MVLHKYNKERKKKYKGERIRVSCQGRLTLIIIWYYISIIRKGRRSIRERG
jgi:hypothetical protein